VANNRTYYKQHPLAAHYGNDVRTKLHSADVLLFLDGIDLHHILRELGGILRRSGSQSVSRARKPFESIRQCQAWVLLDETALRNRPEGKLNDLVMDEYEFSRGFS
jgi:hypothetical protein